MEGYSIKERIGEGTFGVIYSCVQLGTQKSFAMKRMKKKFEPRRGDQGVCWMGLREIKLLRELDCKNVINVSGFGD